MAFLESQVYKLELVESWEVLDSQQSEDGRYQGVDLEEEFKLQVGNFV